MKVLSNEEFKKELVEMLPYDIYNIAINTEDIKNSDNNNFIIVECLDLDCDRNSIILDIEDINKITNNKDLLVMSASEQYGLNSAKKAIKSIVSDFEENKLSLIKADGILVHFQVNSNYNTMDFLEAMEIIYGSYNSLGMIKEPDVIPFPIKYTIL